MIGAWCWERAMTADTTSLECAFPMRGCSPTSCGAQAPWLQQHAHGRLSSALISWNCRLGTISTMRRHWSGWCAKLTVPMRHGLVALCRRLGLKRSAGRAAPYDGESATLLADLARVALLTLTMFALVLDIPSTVDALRILRVAILVGLLALSSTVYFAAVRLVLTTAHPVAAG